MRAFTALVVHEVNQRKALLAAAAVASVLPLLAPLLPATGSNPPADTRDAVMWAMVLGLVPLFALLLGVSFVGRDLAEGRLGYYYAQPLSGPTIWFGKLTAVLLLVWGAQLLIMLPTVVLAPDPARFLTLTGILDPFTPRWAVPVISLMGTAIVVLVAHAVGTFWRSRTAWLVVDTLALLVVIAIGWSSMTPFLPLVAPDIVVATMWWFAGLALVGLVVGGAIQVAVGRVDPLRSHRALSLGLWTILIAGTAATFSWTVWVRSAGLEDLAAVTTVAAGPGDWIAVSGPSPGRYDYRPRFLLNVATGRSTSIGPATGWRSPELVVSSDGSTAAWLEAEGFPSWDLVTADLSSEVPEPLPTGVTLGPEWKDFAVAPDGSRVAVLDGRTLSVYQGRPAVQLTAVKISDEVNPIRIVFDDADTVRMLVSSRDDGTTIDNRWWLLWFDVADRRLSDRVPVETPWRWSGRSRDGRADNPVTWIRDGDHSRLMLRDPETGDVIRDLGVMRSWDVTMMDDGSVVIIHDGEGAGSALELFEPSGELVRRFELPQADEVFAGGMVADGRLLLGLVDRSGSYPNVREADRTLLLDLTTGRLSEVSDRYCPVFGRWWQGQLPGPGSVAGRLLGGEDGSLHLLDPKTGKLRQLVPVPD